MEIERRQSSLHAAGLGWWTFTHLGTGTGFRIVFEGNADDAAQQAALREGVPVCVTHLPSLEAAISRAEAEGVLADPATETSARKQQRGWRGRLNHAVSGSKVAYRKAVERSKRAVVWGSRTRELALMPWEGEGHMSGAQAFVKAFSDLNGHFGINTAEGGTPLQMPIPCTADPRSWSQSPRILVLPADPAAGPAATSVCLQEAASKKFWRWRPADGPGTSGASTSSKAGGFELTASADAAARFRFVLLKGYRHLLVRPLYALGSAPAAHPATMTASLDVVHLGGGDGPGEGDSLAAKDTAFVAPQASVEVAATYDEGNKALQQAAAGGFTQAALLKVLKAQGLSTPAGFDRKARPATEASPALLAHLAKALNLKVDGLATLPSTVRLLGYQNGPGTAIRWRGRGDGLIGLEVEASHDGQVFFPIESVGFEELAALTAETETAGEVTVSIPMSGKQVLLTRSFPDLLACLGLSPAEATADRVLKACEALEESPESPPECVARLRALLTEDGFLAMYRQYGFHALYRHRLRLSPEDKARRKKQLLVSGCLVAGGLAMSAALAGPAAALAAAAVGPAAVTPELLVAGVGALLLGSSMTSAGVSSGLGCLTSRRLEWKDYRKRARRGAIVGAFTGIALGGADALIAEGLGEAASSWLVSHSAVTAERALSSIGCEALGESAAHGIDMALQAASPGAIGVAVEGSTRAAAGVVGAGAARVGVNVHDGERLAKGLGHSMFAGALTATAGFASAKTTAHTDVSRVQEAISSRVQVTDETIIASLSAVALTVGEESADLLLDTQSDSAFDSREVARARAAASAQTRSAISSLEPT